MKEFELTLSLRNNCIRKRRVSLGLTLGQLSASSGVSYSRLCEFESMRVGPTSRKSESGWKPSAEQLAGFFGCEPGDLFPDAVLAIRQPKVVAEIAAEQALALAALGAAHELPPTPGELLEVAERDATVRQAMAWLRPEEQAVLAARYAEEKSLEETAGELGVSRERVRQIESKAIQRLRRRNLKRVGVSGRRSRIENPLRELL